MTYLWLKAFHIAAVMTWMGGLFLLALTHAWIRAGTVPRPAEAQAVIASVRKWDAWVTSPAMGAAWLIGLGMAVHAGVFYAPWLSVKLVIVVALSGLHGMLSGALRRLAAEPARKPPEGFRFAGPGMLVALLAVVVLAVTKPF